MTEVENVFQLLHKRQEELQEGVFRTPPSDWAGFQRALGQWMEVENLIQEVRNFNQQREDLL